jgi:hypothetical protein
MKNKQKLWRRAAAGVKRAMLKTGKHERGARYGRFTRLQQVAMTKIKALPSQLFIAMAKNASII